jgi:hypothetical protein
MGLFNKSGKSSSKGVDKPPPVFNKHSDDHLLKGQNHVRRASVRRASLSASISSLNSLNKVSAGYNSKTTNGTFAIPDYKGKKAKSASSDGSYFEEIFDDVSYEEEIIEDDYLEEEFIDELFSELPPRKITIRFDEFDVMQTVLHINDYSNHEISKAWYKREDYDKMVQSARKAVLKVEERQKELGRMDGKKAAAMETRGLESWTTVGVSRVRLLKESALEAVWNEQNKQWTREENDPDKIREAYLIVSKGSERAAKDRGHADSLIVDQMRRDEDAEEDKKLRRRMLAKSKALIGKSVRATAGGVVKTGKLVGKTTMRTGKVAFGAGKVATKTAVATATLDRRMLKETLIPERKMKDVERKVYRRQSLSSRDLIEVLGGKAALTVASLFM